MKFKIAASFVSALIGICFNAKALANSNTVKVMTYNVHYGVNAEKTNLGENSALDQLVSCIKEEGVDVAFVQEFPYVNNHPDFKFTGARANPTAFIRSMLPDEYTVYEEVVRDGTTDYRRGKSQLIITRLPKIGGPYVKHFPEPRHDMIRQIALLKLSVNGKPLWVGNTHPWHIYDGLNDSDLDAIVQYLKATVPAEDAIVWGGDLNFDGGKHPDKYNKFIKAGFKDAYASATGKYAETKLYNTILGADPGTHRIDYFFYRNIDSCSNYKRGESKSSDHYPVFATFTLSSDRDSSGVQQAGEPICGKVDDQDQVGSLRGTEKPERVKVLGWNLLHAGNDVEGGPEKILALIRKTKADICLLQEAYDIDGGRPHAGAWLAGELGWNYYQGGKKKHHLCVLTHFPILQDYFYHSHYGLGARLDLGEGREVVAYSTWIDYRHTVDWGLKENPDISDEDLLKREATRQAQTKDILGYLKEQGHLSAKYPVLVGGDWNCPSHLDWTEETEAAMPLSRRALPLPSSLEMEKAGFSDCFRAVYPDPVKVPGNTWSPMYENRPRNRIDRLYVKNPASGFALVPVAATVIPEEGEYEDNSIPHEKRAFPSDHAAVLIEFEVSEIK